MDITTKDFNRRELELNKNFVKEALPAYFVQEYPNIIKFLEYYLEFLKESGTGSVSLDELRKIRDITQTNETLLKYIENELILGENYFKGFSDRRAATKFSYNLYSTKGSKFSIQQFFRTFYNLDPEIVYTKNNVFHVYGEDQTDSFIGAESDKFIINDKLYQTFALLIKVALPVSVWGEAYKLFVHPAGFYFGSEVQVVSIGTFNIQTPRAIADSAAVEVLSVSGDVIQSPYSDFTGIVASEDSDGIARINLEDNIARFASDSDFTIIYADGQYESLQEISLATSPTFDDDSDGVRPAIRMSNTFETMDQDKYDILNPVDGGLASTTLFTDIIDGGIASTTTFEDTLSGG